MQPVFSIVIPTYNRAKLIPHAIEGVLAQTFKDWELVVVDDGSTDNTRAVVEKYAGPRIKYIYQENAERSAARNNGIKQSTGKYICFVDSDDYYLPIRLEMLYGELEKRNFPEAVFYTGIAYEYGDEIRNLPELPNTFDNNSDFLAQALIGNPQVCAHRNIFLHHQFNPAFHIGEDMELWLRVAEQYPFIHLENQFTVIATDHDDRSVNVIRNNSFADQLRMFRFIFSPSHPGHKVSPAIKNRLLANCYYGIAKFYIYNNRRLKAAMAIFKSIILDIRSVQLKFRINILLKLITLAPMSKVQGLIHYFVM